MRWVGFALACWMPAAVLSGCVATPAEESPDFVPARALYDVALARAMAWDEEATFFTALAVEEPDPAAAHAEQEKVLTELQSSQTQEVLVAYDAMRAGGDPNPGDGLAPAWLYSFQAPDGTRRTIIVAANGSVVLDRDNNMSTAPDWSTAGMEPAWTLDSDEVARIALANDTEFRELARTPGTSGQVQLLLFRGVVAWQIFLEDVTGLNRGSAYIDSKTGNVLSIGVAHLQAPIQVPAAPSVPGPLSPREAGSVSGTIEEPMLSDDQTHTFEVEAGDHEQMVLRIEALEAKGPVSIRVFVERPEHGTFQMSVEGIGKGGTLMQDSMVDPAPDAGPWNLRVSLYEGLLQKYRISWCTDGIAEETAPPVAACESLSFQT